MKKYLLGLAAVVLALSLSAFTGDHKKAVKTKTATLHWFVAPYGSGDFVTSTATVAERTANIDCDENPGAECERAFTDGQLLTSDPEDGVHPGSISSPAKTIYLQ